MSPSWKNRLTWILEHARPALTYLPAVLVTAWIAQKSISGILERVGHPAVPLDDAFIHFQYARNLAHGNFFHYAPGQGYVAGFTSLLWPLAFVPFYWLGVDDLSIVWVAWIYGFASFAALQVETFRLAHKLTGRAVALSASAMCALFGGFIWFAGSGMETMTLAWVLLRTARLASDWCEAPTQSRTSRLRNELLVFGALAPLVRPEGAIASAFAAAALMVFPAPSPTKRWKARLLGAAPLAGSLLLPLMHLLMTGSASSNTTTVKWLPVNPYYSASPLFEQVWTNIHVLFSTLLNGEQWSAVYLPEGSLPFALMALFAIPIAGWRVGKPWRALYVFAVALSILAPCTYHTFLWNRLRYLWPFVPAWFIGAACLSRLVGEALGLIRPRWSLIAPIIGGVIAGSLLGNFKWTSTDLAKSAAAIDGQQVKLGRWASENLPKEAIIGVSDTGAIAYFSNRPTFDVIGLTTQGEAPYWVAGAGSRFEHYERLHAESPERFPTHFIVLSALDAVQPGCSASAFTKRVCTTRPFWGAPRWWPTRPAQTCWTPAPALYSKSCRASSSTNWTWRTSSPKRPMTTRSSMAWDEKQPTRCTPRTSLWTTGMGRLMDGRMEAGSTAPPTDSWHGYAQVSPPNA